jgi:hypothetical protein
MVAGAEDHRRLRLHLHAPEILAGDQLVAQDGGMAAARPAQRILGLLRRGDDHVLFRGPGRAAAGRVLGRLVGGRGGAHDGAVLLSHAGQRGSAQRHRLIVQVVGAARQKVLEASVREDVGVVLLLLLLLLLLLFLFFLDGYGGGDGVV